MSFVPVGSVVGRNIRKNGVSQQVIIALAIERAAIAMSAMLGEGILDNARPLYIRQKTLNIASLNAPASAAVGRVRDEIITATNQGAPYRLVERIRIIA